ncbi:MAG: hypothetical protein EXS16_04675 [Gemmataceae bacterium]|nr:hypothetical protein [Gemmataceae bacterium]
MHHLCLLAMFYAGDVAEPASPKEPCPTNSLYYVQATVDAGPTNARGLQIVTIRLKLKPIQRVYETPRGKVEHISSRALTMKLTAATRDTKTQVDVIYPKGHEDGKYITYASDELAIQVLIQRADGDRSPVQGQVDFGVMGSF